MKNNLLSPLTILLDVTRDRKGRVGYTSKNLHTAVAIASRGIPQSDDFNPRDALAASLEAYLRKMIASCATCVHIPYKGGDEWMRPRDLKRLLSPTTKKSIRFVDQRDKYWQTTNEYLKPLATQLGPNETLESVAWDLYLLILAVKKNAEVVLPPERTLSSLGKLEKMPSLDAEGRSRLALLAGVFNCFEPSSDGPSLQFLPSIFKLDVTERIEEIMEDAYLLEASRLRRFLGIKQNVASIKRDLRKVLTFISRNRSWAKGLVGIGSTTILGGDASAKALDKLANLIPTLESGAGQPVLSHPYKSLFGKDKAYIEVTRGVTQNYFSLQSD